MITLHIYNTFAMCSPLRHACRMLCCILSPYLCDKVNEHISHLQVTGLLGSIWCHLRCLHKDQVPQEFSCTPLGPRDSDVNIKKLFSLSAMFTFGLIVTRLESCQHHSTIKAMSKITPVVLASSLPSTCSRQKWHLS